MYPNGTDSNKPDLLSQQLSLRETMPVEFKARRWTLRVIALLLAGQAIILLAILWVGVTSLNWQQEFRKVVLSMTVRETLLLGGFLLPMALWGLSTAMELWQARRRAWLRAMMAQGMLLIFCLSSYFVQQGEWFIYLLMLTCIIIVLYLNAYDVRLSFTSREPKNRIRSL